MPPGSPASADLAGVRRGDAVVPRLPAVLHHGRVDVLDELACRAVPGEHRLDDQPRSARESTLVQCGDDGVHTGALSCGDAAAERR